MERPNYKLEQNPQYTEDIPRLLNDDPVLAESGAFHDLIVQSLNNTKASYQKAEKAQQTADRRASITLSHEKEVPAKGDNTYTFQVTELSDVAGELDGERLENARRIGELEGALNGFKIYTDLSQLGITSGEETITGICSVMPNNSVLVYSKASATGNQSAYPSSYGLLKFIRKNQGRVDVEFSNRNGKYYGWYAEDTGDVSTYFSGWKKLGAADEVAPVNHASAEELYGKATSAVFGHVKLSNAVNWQSSSYANAVAATPYAVRITNDRIDELEKQIGAMSGTWTPELVDADGNTLQAGAYSSQRGRWSRIGGRVFLDFAFTCTYSGELGGAIYIPVPSTLNISSANYTSDNGSVQAYGLSVSERTVGIVPLMLTSGMIRLDSMVVNDSGVTSQQVLNAGNLAKGTVTIRGKTNYIGA